MKDRDRRQLPFRVLVTGSLLALSLGIIACLSHALPHDWRGETTPLFLFLLVFLSASACYFYAIFWLFKQRKQLPGFGSGFVSLFLLGLLSRLIFIGSEPILEDDIFRYFWDGALLANGFNSFANPPSTFVDPDALGTFQMELQILAKSGAATLAQVNYPDLTTVYPPIAQLWFAISYWMTPWSFEAWRGLLLLSELVGLFFICLTLTKLNKSPLWALIYWWNPMVILQFSNGLHVDAVLTMFLFIAIYLFWIDRPVLACFPLLAAVGVKLWPIILLPFFLKFLWQKKIMFFGTAFAVTLGACLLASPLLLFQNADGSNGLETYSKLWQMNDGVYSLIHSLSWFITSGFVEEPVGAWRLAHGVARLLIVIVLITFIAYRFFHAPTEKNSLLSSMFWVTTLLFLLGPTVFPWYYPWALVFLVFMPRPSILVLTETLSLYYLRFYFAYWGQEVIYDSYLVWVQFIPVLVLFAIEQKRPLFKDLSAV